MTNRTVKKILSSVPTSDGDGVKISRIAGRSNITTLDPFILLDEIASDDSADYVGGFPSHPHRGFETVTYMLEGAFTHEDHLGNKGHLQAGGVQWMTAGKGVIHSEMPEQDEGRLHGFQLWLNLPAKDKMQTASYQEFNPGDIPVVECDNGGKVSVIAGSFLEANGPITQTATQVSYFDVSLLSASDINVPTINTHNTLVYVYDGSVTIEGVAVEKGQLAQLSEGDNTSIKSANNGAGFLLLSGAAINEPVAQYGPFVMNTQEEIEQAILDYNAGTLTD